VRLSSRAEDAVQLQDGLLRRVDGAPAPGVDTAGTAGTRITPAGCYLLLLAANHGWGVVSVLGVRHRNEHVQHGAKTRKEKKIVARTACARGRAAMFEVFWDSTRSHEAREAICDTAGQHTVCYARLRAAALHVATVLREVSELRAKPLAGSSKRCLILEPPGSTMVIGLSGSLVQCRGS
jgi:hypothetical protein